jgi:hypothetical protein
MRKLSRGEIWQFLPCEPGALVDPLVHTVCCQNSRGINRKMMKERKKKLFLWVIEDPHIPKGKLLDGVKIQKEAHIRYSLSPIPHYVQQVTRII